MTKQANDIGALLKQLDSFRTRAEARRQLAEMGEQAAPRVLEALVNEPRGTPNKRWALVALLAHAQYEPAVPALLDVLRNEPTLRGDACRALQQITGKDIGEDVNDWERAISGQTDEDESGSARAAVGAEAVEIPEKELIRQAFESVATKISWEGDPPYAYLRIPLKDNRKQQMIVTFNETDENANDIISIYTECGPASPSTEATAQRRNVTIPYGRFVIEQDEDDGHTKVVMRHALARLGLTGERLREIVLSMAREADSFEFELTNQDRI